MSVPTTKRQKTASQQSPPSSRPPPSSTKLMDLPDEMIRKIHAHAQTGDARRLRSASTRLQSIITRDDVKNHPYREERFQVPGAIRRCLFSPDSSKIYVVTTTKDGVTFISAYDLQSEQRMWEFIYEIEFVDIALTHAGDRLAIVWENDLALSIDVHDTATGEIVIDTLGYEPYVGDDEPSFVITGTLCFSYDDSTLAFFKHESTQSPRKVLRVWKITNDESIAPTLVFSNNVAKSFPGISPDDLAFCPTNSNIIAVVSDQELRLYDISARIKVKIRLHFKGGFLTKFSPDGKLLAIPSKLNKIVLWDVAKREQTRTLVSPQTSNVGVSDISFSADGVRLAAIRPGHVDVWNVKTKELLASNDWEDDDDVDEPPLVQFLPDNNIMTFYDTVSADIMDLGTSSVLRKIQRTEPERGYYHEDIDKGNPRDSFFSLSPDGRKLAISKDGNLNTVRIVPIKPLKNNYFQGGGAQYKGRTYAVHQGSRGGKYILVGREKRKIYV